MVQFNLLPDIKLQYVKARRQKHLITFLSVAVGGAALAILLFALFFVKVVQQKSISDLDNDITKYSEQLKSTDDLDKMLTVQNQLRTLTGLHEDKPVATRVFGYLTQLTPATVNLNQLTMDFDNTSMTVGGKADSFESVKLYADTFKATTYTTPDSESAQHAFKDVVLSSFSKSEQGASFALTMAYEPAIFDVNQEVTLVVPTQTTSSQANIFGTEEN